MARYAKMVLARCNLRSDRRLLAIYIHPNAL
jgi:hypothetical protein